MKENQSTRVENVNDDININRKIDKFKMHIKKMKEKEKNFLNIYLLKMHHYIKHVKRYNPGKKPKK